LKASLVLGNLSGLLAVGDVRGGRIKRVASAVAEGKSSDIDSASIYGA